jgi:uncharacterized membrane protein YfcA
MEIAIGFLIAVAIGLTGVGGGVITAPVLILFLGLPAPIAVGTALLYVTIVKTIATPVYLFRKQVDFKILGLLLIGGIPGVVAGSVLLKRAHESGMSGLVLALVGLTVVSAAAVNLYRLVFKTPRSTGGDHRGILPFLSAGIGLEVGFSSAGAGALGTVALMQFTQLAPATVVGTDLLFGFAVSAVGGGMHVVSGSYHAALLLKLAIGGVFGALIGAQLAGLFPTRLMRAVLSLWVGAMGVQLCYRGLGALLARL